MSMKIFVPDVDYMSNFIYKKWGKKISNSGFMILLKEEDIFRCHFGSKSFLKNFVKDNNVKTESVDFIKSMKGVIGPNHVFSPLFRNEWVLTKREYNESLGDNQFSPLRTSDFNNALAIPIFDNECLGLIVYFNVKEKSLEKRVFKLREEMKKYIPHFCKIIRLNNLEKAMKNADIIEKRFRQYNEIIKDLNQLHAEPYQFFMRQVLNYFHFDVAYLLIEENGKFNIIKGCSSKGEYDKIVDDLYSYFSKEENKIIPTKAEMALCYAYISKKYFYFKDIEAIYPFESWKDRIDEAPFLPKDKISLKIINRPIRTILHVPILDQDKPIGVLELFSFDNNIVELNEDELNMIQNITSFVPSILRNISLYNKIEKINKVLKEKHTQIASELKMASKIQESLISPTFLDGYSFSSEVLYKPMENIGGDFFDFVRIREPNFLGVFISDVSGHGVPAALVTMMLKILIDQAGKNKLSSSAMLKYLNNGLFNRTGGNFLTAFYGIIDFSNKEFIYSNAAHNPPYIVRGKEIIPLTTKGKFLGIFENIDFEEKRVKLEPNDRLILYTDGIPEAADDDGNLFEDRFMSLLVEKRQLPPNEFVDCIYKELLSYKGGFVFEDDICLVCIDID